LDSRLSAFESGLIGEKRVMKKLVGKWLVTACVLGVTATAHAGVTTVDLGVTSQWFTETAIGIDSSNYARWFLTYGTCTPSGADTSCVLSGSYSSSSRYGSGTYSMVTTYAGDGPTFSTPYGNGPSPIVGVSTTPGGGFSTIEYAAPGTTIALDLDESGGASYTIPLYGSTGWVTAFDIYQYGAAVCSTDQGDCWPFGIAGTPGATWSAQQTGIAYIYGAPEPSALALFGFGLASLGVAVSTRRRPNRL
jgi:hypothetical protein